MSEKQSRNHQEESEDTMGEDHTLPIETVQWREGVARTLSKIDKRTEIMQREQKNFVTMPQVEQRIKEANAEQLEEHTKFCGLQRQNEQLKRDQANARPSKKTPTSIAPPASTRRNRGDILKNLTIPQVIKIAIFIGITIGTFVAGLQMGG